MPERTFRTEDPIGTFIHTDDSSPAENATKRTVPVVTLSQEEEKILSDRIMEDIADEIYLEDFLPRYLNQAIQFTGEDMGGDRAMMLICSTS